MHILAGLLALPLAASSDPAFAAGVLLLPLASPMATGLSRLQRWRLKLLTGDDYLASFRERLSADRLFASVGRRHIVYNLVLALWGTTIGVLFLAALSVSLFMLSLPLLHAGLTAEQARFAGVALTPSSEILIVAMGAAALLALVALAPALAGTEGGLAVRFAGDTRASDLNRRIADLEDSRSRMVDAAAAERLRIQRDLHDGAQQRLIAVGLAVARARRNLGDDQRKLGTLLEEAYRESKAAVQELRTVARGLHPPVLSERGLLAAVKEMSHRNGTPVVLEFDAGTEARPSARAEAVAYYVIAESLANIAKHANATRSAVRVRRRGGRLHIVVTDDGRGGAVMTGGGLAGLHDRVRAIDGTLSLTSPEGGPTMLEAELPWNA